MTMYSKKLMAWVILVVLALAPAILALPPFVDSDASRLGEEARAMELKATQALNPHVQFDDNRRFYAFVANSGRHHMHEALAYLERNGHYLDYAKYRNVRENYIKDVLDKLNQPGQITVRDPNSNWLLRYLIRQYDNTYKN